MLGLPQFPPGPGRHGSGTRALGMLWRVGTRLGTGRCVEGGGPEESRGAAASKAEVRARLSKTCAAGLPGSLAAAAQGTPECPRPVASKPKDCAGGCAPGVPPGEWPGGMELSGDLRLCGDPRAGTALGGDSDGAQLARAGLGCAIRAGGRVCLGEPCLGIGGPGPAAGHFLPRGWRHLSRVCCGQLGFE